MKDPEISIIVPIYNVERYLMRCINSVLEQSFKDWELILVDDGSPDQCSIICEDAKKLDPRIKLIHKENGGLVSARRVGFSISSGTYIIHLDADDWLLEDALETYYTEIKKGYDIVRSLVTLAYDDNSTSIRHFEKENGVVETSLEYQNNLFDNKIAPYLHSAIYRRELFCDEIFEKVQNYTISIGEDWVTNVLMSVGVNNVCFLEKSLYAYYVNNFSMMHQKVVSHNYTFRVDKCILEYVNSSSAYIKDLYKKNIVCGAISRFFIPELPFSFSDYYMVRDYMRNKHQSELVRTSVRSVYLKFVRFSLLYFLYTRIYCFLFWIFKLKFTSRSILN